MHTLAITGATGPFGRAVLSHFARLIPADTHVVECTRNPDQLDKLGFVDEIRKADFAVEAAARASVRACVRRNVYTSFFDVAPEYPPWWRAYIG